MKHQLWLRPATLFVAIVALVLVGFAANTHTASAQVGAGCPKGSSWQWIDNVMWCVPSGVAVQPPVEAYYPRPNCYGLTNASCPVNDLDTNKISPDKSRQMTYVGK
ncbi:MAG TPA: hypothetical protein VJ201_04075, partial [Candidatus Babeliales bacterium]|nr:hypothetical protein [Candidatus Babeliales bacterium]